MSVSTISWGLLLWLSVQDSASQQLLAPESGSRALHQIRDTPRALNEIVSSEARVGLVILLLITARVDEVLRASSAVRSGLASAVGLGDLVVLEDGLWDASVGAVVWQVLDVHGVTDWHLLLHGCVRESEGLTALSAHTASHTHTTTHTAEASHTTHTTHTTHAAHTTELRLSTTELLLSAELLWLLLTELLLASELRLRTSELLLTAELLWLLLLLTSELRLGTTELLLLLISTELLLTTELRLLLTTELRLLITTELLLLLLLRRIELTTG